MEKTRKNVKKAIFFLFGGVIGAGGFLSIPYTSQIVRAAETDRSGFDAALNKAGKTEGIILNKTTKEIEVSSSAEAQSLIDGQTKKINDALAKQAEDVAKHEELMNDPDVILKDVKPACYTKEQLINLLKVDGKFTYRNVCQLDLRNAKSFKTYYKNPTLFTDEEGHDWHIASEGDYHIAYKAVRNTLTNKFYDVKITVTTVTNDNAQTDKDKCISFKNSSVGGWSYKTSCRYKVEFFESGTNTPAKISVIFRIKDIDGGTNSEGAETPEHFTLVTDPVGSTLPQGDKIVRGRNSYDMLTFTGKINKDKDDEMSAVILYRGVDAFTFAWNAKWIGFVGADLNLYEPPYPSARIDIFDYKFIQKGKISFFDETDNVVLKEDTFSGVPNSDIGYDAESVIKHYESKGFELVSNNYKCDEKYDNDVDKDQEYNVVLKHAKSKKSDRDEYKTIKRTIYYKYNTKDGKDAAKKKEQTVTIAREGEKDLVTDEITWDEWKKAPIEEVISPNIEGYTKDREKIDEILADENTKEEIIEYVIYTPEEVVEEKKTDEKITQDGTKSPSDPEKTTKKVKAVDTGDASKKYIYAILGSAAAGVITTLILMLRKEKT